MAVKTVRYTKAYPMDSAAPVEYDDETGLPVYDRAYNGSDLRGVIRLMLTDGVFPDLGDELAVTRTGSAWSVGTGAFVAHGLVVHVGEAAANVFLQTDVPSGSYAWVIAAGRFDSENRDGAIYAVVTQSTAYEPTRTDSLWELVLARIDSRGTLRDLRMDNGMCGPVTAVCQPDTESFMLELRTAVSQFNLNVGTVTSLPSGSQPTVTVRRPDEAGGEVYVDFGIPRGAPGEDGEDGRGTNVHVAPESSPPPGEADAVWLVDDDTKTPHEITGIRTYGIVPLYPGASTWPGPTTWPGGSGGWVDHVISPALVGQQ